MKLELVVRDGSYIVRSTESHVLPFKSSYNIELRYYVYEPIMIDVECPKYNDDLMQIHFDVLMCQCKNIDFRIVSRFTLNRFVRSLPELGYSLIVGLSFDSDKIRVYSDRPSVFPYCTYETHDQHFYTNEKSSRLAYNYNDFLFRQFFALLNSR